MSNTQPPFNRLNEVQLTLLKMFNHGMSEEETLNIKDLLTSYYSQKLLNEVDAIVIQKNITEADYERLRHENQRTSL